MARESGLRGFWSFLGLSPGGGAQEAQDGARRFTFEELQNLYNVLQRNPIVGPSNRAVVVETIRSIAEFMTWGDQHEHRLFDFFLEHNIMVRCRPGGSAGAGDGGLGGCARHGRAWPRGRTRPRGPRGTRRCAPQRMPARPPVPWACPACTQVYLYDILQQPANCTGDMAKQVLQTLSIIIQNVRSETGIFFLFSNNHINNIVSVRFDYDDEEVLGYYISFLKAISLQLTPRTAQFFLVKDKAGSAHFPLYTEAIKFAHSKEGMVRASVRTLTLNVYSVPDPGIQAFVSAAPAAAYFSDVADYMARQFEVSRGPAVAAAGGRGAGGRGRAGAPVVQMRCVRSSLGRHGLRAASAGATAAWRAAATPRHASRLGPHRCHRHCLCCAARRSWTRAWPRRRALASWRCCSLTRRLPRWRTCCRTATTC